MGRQTRRGAGGGAVRTVEIGHCTLIHADCMEVMREMRDKAFDLAIVEPPYGIDINASGRLGHYGGKNKNWDSFKPDENYFIKLYRASNNQIIWGGNYFNLPPTRCFLIWDKQQPDGVSFASCEFAWTNFDKSAKTFYQRPQNNDYQRIHPTQKPVALYAWLLNHYAKPGDTILDTHLGSGSSAIACNKLGFKFTGIEIDEDYFNAACERIAREYSQTSLFDAPVDPQPLEQMAWL